MHVVFVTTLGLMTVGILAVVYILMEMQSMQLGENGQN